MKKSGCQYGGTEDLPAPDDIKTLWQRDATPSLAIGPIYTRALRQSPSQREKAICNADNYAWFATVSLFGLYHGTNYNNKCLVFCLIGALLDPQMWKGFQTPNQQRL